MGMLGKDLFVGGAFLPLGPSKSLLARGVSKDFIRIPLMHLFHKEEGWAVPRLPSLGRVMVPVELR
jgi:hypothetical protein